MQRYHSLLTGNATGYKVIWKEQDNNHSASKCDKIVINLLKETASSDELLVAITVFITTGRILVQGKGHEDWSKHEFPVLLDIVNQLSSLKSFSSISSVEDKSIFTGSVHNFFGNAIHFVPDDDIPSLSQGVDIANGGTSPLVLESLKITPKRLGTISSLRDTLAQLEVDFTQFRMICSGDIEQMKDKMTQQNNLLKLQKQLTADVSTELSSHLTSFQDIVSQQTTLIKKLQEENQSLQKTQAKLLATNSQLQEQHAQLLSEVNFLKEQVRMLWDHSTGTSEPAQEISRDSTTSESVHGETVEKSLTEDETLLLVNIPTENRFSPLQSSAARLTRNEPDIDRASVPTQENTISTNHNGNEPASEDDLPPNVKIVNTSYPPHPPSAVKSNTAVFLCDSNGKFLDKKKLFRPNQELTFFRCPRLENARSILQNDLHEIPEIILIHTGTNDLTATTSIHVFISEFCNLIKESASKFPMSKIIFSTLLPRADIPLQTLLQINRQLISECSKLPNVHAGIHENIFSKELQDVHDERHVNKRHIGVFAANLVNTIRGELNNHIFSRHKCHTHRHHITVVNSVLTALLSRILRTLTLSSTRHHYTLTVNQDSPGSL